ncbi:hypothetical protein ACFFQF_29265 [Haladaptatus pallidirubidus]|uniref:hypothetical protein n=1 Tax=Haladaptatus pallidirubidus TaxID=1008152 RepID=UPI0035E497AB
MDLRWLVPTVDLVGMCVLQDDCKLTVERIEQGHLGRTRRKQLPAKAEAMIQGTE